MSIDGYFQWDRDSREESETQRRSSSESEEDNAMASSPDSEDFDFDSTSSSSRTTITSSRTNTTTAVPSRVSIHSAPASTAVSPVKQPTASMSTFQSSVTQPHPRSSSTTGSLAPRPSRNARIPALSPLTTNSTLASNPKPSGLPLGQGALPKAQPLARALFARKLSGTDTPHAGMTAGGKKKGGSTKIIVPTKSFRTTFELDLTASELARK